ncbi:MAG: dihydrodipicolinate synthase family protein, partial [Ilumatobacteraceae bacterium]
LPVMLYDIPVRSGRKISTDTMLRLAREVPTVVALKDAANNPGESAALLSRAPAGFELYSGEDMMTLPLLASGAVGTVGVATHWTGPDHQELFRHWESGDLAAARLVNARLVESFVFEGGDDAPNPIPTKAVMRHLGFRVGQARLPLGPAPVAVEQRVPEVLERLQRWRDAFPSRPGE